MRRAFTKLPLLEHLVRREPSDLLQGVVLVATQHLLESTGSLVEAMISLGIDPRNCYMQGKLYSTSVGVAIRLRELGVYVYPSTTEFSAGHFVEAFRTDTSSLWDCVESQIRSAGGVNTIIVLDDGGRCISSVPKSLVRDFRIIGIEQTTSGLSFQEHNQIPIVQVAQSAVKRHIEPPLIATAVLAKVASMRLSLEGRSIGVIGLGNIGLALAKGSVELGHRVVAFDNDANKLSAAPENLDKTSLRELIRNSDIIFGCTGSDISEDFDFSAAEFVGDQFLASCSSEDVEFRSLLRTTCDHGASNSLSDLSLKRKNGRTHILRGGFPVNFDGSTESVPSQDIQLTRSLLLAAVIQCRKLQMSDAPNRIMLDPEVQLSVLCKWLRLTGREPNRMVDLTWFVAHSGGRQVA